MKLRFASRNWAKVEICAEYLEEIWYFHGGIYTRSPLTESYIFSPPQDLVNAYNSTRNTVPETIICYYGHEMLSILATLHQCGIIHADVKPDNFMLKDLR